MSLKSILSEKCCGCEVSYVTAERCSRLQAAPLFSALLAIRVTVWYREPKTVKTLLANVLRNYSNYASKVSMALAKILRNTKAE